MSRTGPLFDSTRETVATDTPAASATSLIRNAMTTEIDFSSGSVFTLNRGGGSEPRRMRRHRPRTGRSPILSALAAHFTRFPKIGERLTVKVVSISIRTFQRLIPGDAMPPLLTAELVRLGAKADSKHDAIGQAGALLVAAGVIEPGYVDSLLGRERVSNTYLGSGVAIPHGLQEDRHLIRRTGVAVLQLPDGVEWQGGERARLVVAIAAQSDEHIVLLQRLTRLIGDPAQLERLLAARDSRAIVDALNGARPA
ncbi:PTS sugar transporter subunit IIA, partial [Burkholderia thailandensis]